ncbi:hypothetical protein [Halorubrum tibetense]|uniref:Big-1 domain-containing protein n=1 Tax=Halorubrum tibetense TaxID=175631 RepID=A0ABD5S7E2_9EURY
MGFSHDRRGQSVVVGTVILFGFLIIALSVYQVQFVPAENSEIEFEHSQQVEGDFQDLRNGILQAGSTGAAQSQRIRLGTRYPQRTFFLNPPAATGELRTTEERTDLEIRNVEIGDDAADNVKEFWSDRDLRFDTRSIQYTPGYNEFRNGPRLTYEHSVVAAEFPNDAALFRSGQTVVGDDRISLTALTGELSESGVEPRSVDLGATSQGTRTIPINVDDETNIVLPTATDSPSNVEEQWNNRLPDGIEAEADGNEDTVTISFDEEGEFRLRLAEVAVDDSESADAKYVVRVGPENVPSGVDVGVEVRDTYNNPVSDERVYFGDPDGNETEALTDDEGRAFFSTSDSGTYNASINGSEDGDPHYESVDFTVSSAGSGGETNRTYTVSWDGGNPGTIPIDSETEINGTVKSNNEPLTNATVDFATNSSIATFQGENNTSTTTVEGNFTTNVSTGSEEGNVTLFAASGDDIDSTTVTIKDRVVEEVVIDPDEDQTITSGDDIDFSAEALDADGNVIEDDDGAFDWDAEGGTIDSEGLFTETEAGEYDVTAEFDGVASSPTTVTVEEPTPFGVFAQAEDEFGGQDELDAAFDVSGNTETYDFQVTAFRSGDTQGGTVTIDGESYDLTNGAAQQFVRNNEEIDLLDPNTYQGLSQTDEERLEEISRDLSDQSTVSNLTNTGDVKLLLPDIREQ